MVLVEASIIAGAALAGAAAVQHFYDRYHPRGLYRRSLAIAVANGEAIRNAVEGLRSDLSAENVSESIPELGTLLSALTGLPTQIEAAVSGGIVNASKAVMEAQIQGGLNTPEGPAIQAMGTDAARDKQLTRSLKMAVGADMLGPYAAILSEWAPTVHSWLQEHPDSVQWALSQPWVQGLIKKAASLAGQRGGPSSERNPFLTE